MTSKRDERLPRYIERLRESGWTFSPGELVSVTVVHDDGCAHWRGGLCDCNPQLRMRRNATLEQLRADHEAT